jgi:three-Cys-motif partner protein
MTLPDSDPAKWFYPEHTAVKHRILDGYLRTWISIRGSTSDNLGYIDGFAGRGVYSDGSDGSPIIAMKAAQQLIDKIQRKTTGLKKFICYFVEKDEDNYRCLKDQVEKLKPNCKDVTCNLRNETFEEFTKEFSELSKNNGPIPTLFFIDPFGWDGVPFEAIKGILDNQNTEILLTFMVKDMNRFLTSPFHRDSLNKLYGNSCWEECLKTSSGRENALVNTYLRCITEETKAKFVLPFQLYESEVRRPKYYLIFVTHHPFGLRKMKDIMKNAGSGDFGFKGPDHQTSITQQKLPVFEEMQIKHILKLYAGKRIRFDKFLDEVYPQIEDQIIGALIESDYRALIKKMELEGRIEIERKKPGSRAINYEIMLSFPDSQ